MTKVCQKWFPMGSFKYQKEEGFYMDYTLKEQLDILLKNVINDWDFTLLITGGGEVRVGKSVFAQQIGCYFAYEMTYTYKKKVPWSLNNFVLTGKKLIEKGNELGVNYPYSPLIYDEAGADLTARKVLIGSTGEVLDYFRECGQYNLFNILCIPDFFDLPKSIAITRSIFLIDVTYTANDDGEFERGIFHFYSRRRKKSLYIKGRKELNYDAEGYNFHGTFDNVYTVDEQKYRELKRETLKHRDSQLRNKVILQRNAAFYLLMKECGMKYEELGKRIEDITGVYTPRTTVSDAVHGVSLEKDA